MRRHILCVLIVFVASGVIRSDGKILATVTPKEEIEFGRLLYFERYHLPRLRRMEIQVDIKNATKDKNFGFAIIQVHSFVDMVTMVNSGHKKIVRGTNLAAKVSDNINLTVINTLSYTSVEVAVAAVIYGQNSPVPGGCAIEVDENAASVNLSLKAAKNIMQTDVQAAGDISSLNNSKSAGCDNLFYSYRFYYRYLLQRDLSSETYFRRIKDMIEVTSIQAKGSLASKHTNGPSNRRNFVNVPGTGIIYNVIVRDMNGEAAAYVPAVTYSCHPLWAKNDCYLIPFTVGWVIPALFLMVIGIIRVFVVLENHTRALFYNTFAIGMYITICIIASLDDLHAVGRFGIVIFTGIFFALIMCSISFYYGASLAVLDFTSKLILGWILAILILYLLSDNAHFAHDWVYWTTYFVIILLSLLCTLPVGTNSDNSSCTILKLIPIVVHVIVGANAFLLGLQIFMRSNMLFILLSHMFRIMDKEFKSANGIAKPTAEDLCVFIAMPVLVIMGIFFQSKQIIKMSRLDTTVGHNKSQSHGPPRHRVHRRWGNGSDSVFDSPGTNAANPIKQNVFHCFKAKRGRPYAMLS